MRILDLGCGRAKAPGAIGVDRSADTAADVVHDLDCIPWPFADEQFDVVLCQDVLEHLADVVAVMEEIHRLGRPGCEVRIRVPHFSSVHAFTDVTHRHFFASESFRCFDPEQARYPHTSRAHFETVECRLTLWRPYRFLGIGVLANRFPLRYEKMFAFLCPAQFIEFTLRKI
jgi:predicted SAM-dependent methyltransferase